MVAYQMNRNDDYEFPQTIDFRATATTRRRASPPVGLETSAYMKKRSTKTFQQESSNSAYNLRKSLRILRCSIIGAFLLCFVMWENKTIAPTPIALIEKHNVIEKEQKPDPVETQAMLRRVKNAHLDVPRTALKPSRYTPPNPSLAIPLNLDTLLVDVNQPQTSSDIPFFWHILKSGGTTTKDAAGMCLGKVEASESGVLDGHGSDQVLQKVHISRGQIEYVNVDTTTANGIARAVSMGLAESGISDIIFSPLLHESSQLFNNTTHKGRAFCLFRHPVERAVSLFHYLKQASWEPTFSEKLKKIETVEDYAISEFAENNWMTRFLTNEMTGILTRKHLEVAKEILRRKVLVGLTVDMEKSFERFSKYFGWGDKEGHITADQRSCLKGYLAEGSNRNDHVIAEEGTMGWRILRGNNLFDLELYGYALQLYEEQGKMLGSL